VHPFSPESGYLSLDIVVVDNASPTGAGTPSPGSFPKSRSCAPGGTADTGREQCRHPLCPRRGAKYILVVNNDVVVQKGFLEPMVGMLERDAGIGVVNGKVFYLSEPGNSSRPSVNSIAGCAPA